MLALALVCFVAAAALGVVAMRLKTRLDEYEQMLDVAGRDRDSLAAQLDSARSDVATADRTRDEALERVQRTRRDSAEVANRLRDEVEAREQAEAAARDARERCDLLEAELASGGPVAVLWQLALNRVERTWRTSVSLGLDEPSPLDGATDPLRTAAEITVEAAREEAGADVELVWSGDRIVSPATAVQVLAMIESAVSALAKSARSTTVRVAVGDETADGRAPGGVEVEIEAVDDAGNALVVDVPDGLAAGPGRARIATGAPPGR